ncbi:DUF2760 domain-containing protein, partial [Burkholderia cenocepacia]|nr:DUF2760 domain-containing protein [Burkholderia cenocepacia]
MPESNLSFFGRLSLAVGTFFSVLGNREFAAGVLRVRDGAPAPVAPAANSRLPSTEKNV